MSILHEPGGGGEVAGTRVIAKSLPGVKDVVLRSARERGEVWEAPQPLIIIRAHGSDCCLLEHELGDEDRVGIAGAAPGEIAAVMAIPMLQCAAELLLRGIHG